MTEMDFGLPLTEEPAVRRPELVIRYASQHGEDFAGIHEGLFKAEDPVCGDWFANTELTVTMTEEDCYLIVPTTNFPPDTALLVRPYRRQR